ncbi:MAG: ABC transporter substrate-binding protein [Candidatus Nephthysia bennettiae]|uniref:ABC transporter substrate-binding protein n=1 Tax=Candidatus Nephthysia bennettiae TaxID=3127016 RepID=A0A934K798_9BACT|nr:ABC transporter substrate-binding protein [Candidatus Dormibacteraeota bacterium]MBJ7614216.1 ABC transporter substrate-binding protein [Candidatus Dormibacteraeota bacterium]PZR98505.1 MAG: ABC transporter substrate-binding protein [Candidatus Dormibacteraeota bacterium]
MGDTDVRYASNLILDRNVSRRGFIGGAAGVAFGAASLTSVLDACSTGNTAAPPKGRGGTLVYGMELEGTPPLDPHVALSQGGAGFRVNFPMYEGLFGYDLHRGDVEPPVIPLLAESWTRSNDGKTWTWKLRDGVTFHDGTPWNADAAIFNFRRIYDKSFQYYYAAANGYAALFMPGPVQMEKVDNLTFRTILQRGRPLDEELIFTLMVSPKAVMEKGNDKVSLEPVGTGPFVLKELIPNQKVTMIPTKYWGTKPLLDQLVFRPIPDANQRVAALRAGEVNMTIVLPPDSLQPLRQDGFQVLLKQFPHSWIEHLNCKAGPTADKRVRQAINYAMDTKSLSNNILKGSATPEVQVATQGSAYFDSSIQPYDYNPTKAKKLLADAGFPKGLDTEWWVPTNGSGEMLPVPMTEFLQSNLRESGINVTIKTFEWGAYLNEFFKGVPANVGSMQQSWGLWGSTWWGILFGKVGHPPNGIGNVGFYDNPQVDSIYDQALGAPLEQRIGLSKQIQKIVMDDAAWGFVVHDLAPKGLSPKVHGFVNTHSWFWAFDNVWVG